MSGRVRSISLRSRTSTSVRLLLLLLGGGARGAASPSFSWWPRMALSRSDACSYRRPQSLPLDDEDDDAPPPASAPPHVQWSGAWTDGWAMDTLYETMRIVLDLVLLTLVVHVVVFGGDDAEALAAEDDMFMAMTQPGKGDMLWCRLMLSSKVSIQDGTAGHMMWAVGRRRRLARACFILPARACFFLSKALGKK